MIGVPVVMLAAGWAVIAAMASTPGFEGPRDTVSLIQLIAGPASFDSKRVVVTGYVMLEAQNTAIYLHESDAVYAISRNAVWLDVPLGDESHRVQFHRRYVRVEGTFSARRRGHLDAFSGSLQNISRFDLVEPRPGPLVPAPH
jgi:hypothetical protein